MTDLGPLQQEIMEVIWRLNGGDVRRVLGELNRKRKSPLAYTTVMTVMTQLYHKGLLRRRKVGRGYLYRPASDKRGFIVERISDLISSIVGRYKEPVASNILDALEEVNPKELSNLAEELKKRGYI